MVIRAKLDHANHVRHGVILGTLIGTLTGTLIDFLAPRRLASLREESRKRRRRDDERAAQVDDASPRRQLSLAVRLPPRPRLELTQVSFELQRARHRVLVPRDVRLHGRAQTRGEFVDERANVRVRFRFPPATFSSSFAFSSPFFPVPVPVPVPSPPPRCVCAAAVARDASSNAAAHADERSCPGNVVHDPGSSSSGAKSLALSLAKRAIDGEDQRREPAM